MDLRERYEKNLPLYRRLKDEVVFALNRGLQQEGVKTHSVSARVKEWESLREKTERKGYEDPLAQAEDLVGVRVVTLFLSDLPRVAEILGREFDIAASENRVEGGESATFGYMSVHHVATLRNDVVGPRYDEIKGLPFEVQVRTIVMDAWASVSHYLAYKGEASVPRNLRRDFYALSGLFYVADQHFEMFSKGVLESRAAAEREVGEHRDEEVEINLETVLALLRRKYPDREDADLQAVSGFVEEVTSVGYRDLATLDAALLQADPVLDRYEADDPPSLEPGEPGPARYNKVGIARGALAIADPEYDALVYTQGHAKYRGWLERESGGG